jgi:lysophospholipase L1-like esterase
MKDDNDGCGNDWLMLGLALIIVAVVVVACVAPAHADTQVVGDSLTVQTFGDTAGVDGLVGRPLYGNVGLVARAATPADVLVVALGSNDVARRYPTGPIAQVAALPVACVVLTTVKVGGVTPFYNVAWRAYARRWNRAVHQSGATVANWNAYSAGHGGWFLADGLHLTDAGEAAYARLLTHTATECEALP